MFPIAVVLAGGNSRRFGADKLTALLDGISLLDHAVADLPVDWPTVVVGPARPLRRPADFIREEPAGSGPAAALVTGARECVRRHGDCLVSVPGDAPAGGLAARQLVAELFDKEVDACVGVDETGMDQPLQIAVRGAALATLADLDPAIVAGASARSLLALLDPVRVRLSPQLTLDIDTQEQAASWQRHHPNPTRPGPPPDPIPSDLTGRPEPANLSHPI